MTTKEGQLTWADKRTMGMANSVEANERRLQREPTVIDWDERIANLLDILDDTYLAAPLPLFQRRW
jgi:hypothetical protein